MSVILIEARDLTSHSSADTLGKGLRDFSGISDLCVIVGEENAKQELKLCGENLDLKLQADELMAVLSLLHNDILCKVKEVRYIWCNCQRRCISL